MLSFLKSGIYNKFLVDTNPSKNDDHIEVIHQLQLVKESQNSAKTGHIRLKRSEKLDVRSVTFHRAVDIPHQAFSMIFILKNQN